MDALSSVVVQLCSPGIINRLVKEITALAPSSMRIFVVPSFDRKYGVWTGGSIFTSPHIPEGESVLSC